MHGLQLIRNIRIKHNVCGIWPYILKVIRQGHLFYFILIEFLVLETAKNDTKIIYVLYCIYIHKYTRAQETQDIYTRLKTLLRACPPSWKIKTSGGRIHGDF